METQVSKKPNREPVSQLSIFADNKVGRLNEVIQRLAEKKIHIMAISLLDSTECTIMRFIVDDFDGASELLTQLGYAFTTTEIVVGFIAVFLGAGNAVGGYVVTERMLEMFKTSGSKNEKKESS